VAQQDFDPYELLDALRGGDDVDLIRQSIEMVLQARTRVRRPPRVSAGRRGRPKECFHYAFCVLPAQVMFARSHREVSIESAAQSFAWRAFRLVTSLISRPAASTRWRRMRPSSARARLGVIV
jgi:hypothetical protein